MAVQCLVRAGHLAVKVAGPRLRRSPAGPISASAFFCEHGVTPVVDSVEPPHHVDRSRAEVLLLRQAARDQGYRAALTRIFGSADSRFYHQHGIDAVIFGIGGEGQHSDHEYAAITTITPYYLALTKFLLTLH
jgi:succinyl-diaminopimelate desuccinylase